MRQGLEFPTSNISGSNSAKIRSILGPGIWGSVCFTYTTLSIGKARTLFVESFLLPSPLADIKPSDLIPIAAPPPWFSLTVSLHPWLIGDSQLLPTLSHRAFWKCLLMYKSQTASQALGSAILGLAAGLLMCW